MRCLNGYMVGRLVGYTPEQDERMKDMGISDPKRIYTADDLAPGKNIIFAATGVTDGTAAERRALLRRWRAHHVAGDEAAAKARCDSSRRSISIAVRTRRSEFRSGKHVARDHRVSYDRG